MEDYDDYDPAQGRKCKNTNVRTWSSLITSGMTADVKRARPLVVANQRPKSRQGIGRERASYANDKKRDAVDATHQDTSGELEKANRKSRDFRRKMRGCNLRTRRRVKMLANLGSRASPETSANLI